MPPVIDLHVSHIYHEHNREDLRKLMSSECYWASSAMFKGENILEGGQI